MLHCFIVFPFFLNYLLNAEYMISILYLNFRASRVYNI